MKITNRKISELIAAEYNPRQLTPEQAKNLKDSLLRFGVVDPVIVNIHPERKDVIIGGHQRTKVWEEMGNKEIPTVQISLTPEKERELNIRLNKNSGQWDWATLTEHFNKENLIEWGFEEWNFPEDVDYSILDDSDLTEEISEMESGVRKAIQIEFEPEHYEEAQELVKYWREKDGNIGMMLIEKLKAEK